VLDAPTAGIAVALSRVRPGLFLRLPYTCRAALATSATGWPAAGYGALAIWAAGDFTTIRSAWIFGTPFVLLLLGATLFHQLVMGFGIEAITGDEGLRTLNRLIADRAIRSQASAADVRRALHAAVRLPLWNAVTAGVLSMVVIVGVELLELYAAGPGSPNLWLIARSGLVAAALYMSASLTMGELLTRPVCRALRRVAIVRGVPPYDGFVLARWWRIAAAVVPLMAALAVSVEIGHSPHTGTQPYAVLIGLSVAVGITLGWLQRESQERAVGELAQACRALAAGEDAQLVTGSIDPALLAMATEFDTAARRVGADRRASNARYHALFERSADAILLVDPTTGFIVEASARAERLFATPRADLVGQTLASRLDEATRQRMIEFALDRPAPAEAYIVNASVVRTDGALVPVDMTLAVVSVGDGWVLQTILRDVRDRQRIEHELRRAARRFEELYRVAVVLGDDPAALAAHTVHALAELLECPVATVARVDGDHTLVLASSLAAGHTGPQRRPLVGTPCAEVLARRAPCVFTDACERFPADRDLVAAKVRSYCGVPILGEGDAVIGIVSVVDVRARTFRDEDLQLLTSFARRIGQALERERFASERDALTTRLIESDRVKTEFLGMMSHELRTPLNILLGYTRMLLESISDGDVMTTAERSEVLSRMLAGGLHLGELVEDTLSVLRLEAGVVQIDAAPVTLPAFFEELQSVDRLLRHPSEVVERWTVDADVPALVTDRRKLRQVLTNLVGNARKFTARGLIEVSAARAAGGGVTITVRDTGPGIAPADLPYIFDLYRQAPSERRNEGCGLGLYIVRRYVALVGGRVSCTSRLGEGTTFVVDLPATAATTPASVAA
jgi:PAS domain S-box-containing protein